MSKLYIANCSAQEQHFFYRVLESPSPRSQKIPSGRQLALSGDLSPKQIKSVIDQSAKYGLVCEDEIDRTKKFTGLCYQIDRPVTVENMQHAVELNTSALQREGERIRKEAAVYTNQELHKEGSGLQETEISIVEEESKNNPNPSFAEGLRIPNVPEGERPSADQSGGRRGKRRKSR